MNEDFSPGNEGGGDRGDVREEAAVIALARLFDENRERVFFSRQLEVLFEGDYFHWVTNRAIRELVAAGTLRSEVGTLREAAAR